MIVYTAERQRAQPYLGCLAEPLFEQWYLLHHRIVRVVTNREILAEQVCTFLFYAELLAEYSYESPSDLPVAIPEHLLWQAGQRVYRPIALTCYLFETRQDEPFPPEPAEAKPETVPWEEISGVEGPLRARWMKGSLHAREYQAYPGVTGRICSVLDKKDLHATIFIEDVSKCTPWFVMRFVFYMVLGAMFGQDGYEIVHAGAVACEGAGVLLIGSPGSGKSTLVLSCLCIGMQHLADDVLFLARDDENICVYAFPEDIGVRSGASDLLGHYEFMRTLTGDEREKRFVDVQRYFRTQVIAAAPVRLLLFVNARNRQAEFYAEQLSPAQAVSLLMQEYISRQRAQESNVDDVFALFSDMSEQAAAYRLFLTPDAIVNAERVAALLDRHR